MEEEEDDNNDCDEDFNDRLNDQVREARSGTHCAGTEIRFRKISRGK